MENVASPSVVSQLVQGWFVAQFLVGVLAIVVVEFKEFCAADRAQ